MISTPYYIGNGAYCYANSAAMLLNSIGENTKPALIEVLCGIGLGAFWLENKNLLFFNFALPDEELTRAFNILGFEVNEVLVPKISRAPIEDLKNIVETTPIVIGPLDMGFLTYNPNYRFLYGSDHYILIYGFSQGMFKIHDPERYPCVLLSEENLEKFWNSKEIFYGHSNYRYWASPKRVGHPSDNDIYSKALTDFASIYNNCEIKTKENNWITGTSAILKAAKRAEKELMTQEEKDHYRYFVLPLGAKRALDFARFFEEKNPELAKLKIKQAELFGKSQSQAVAENWQGFGETLLEFADTEESFKNALIG